MILTGHLMLARCSLLGPGAGLPLAPGDGLLAATPGRTGLQAARCVLGRLLLQPMGGASPNRPAGRGVRCVPERPASTAPHWATLACATSGRVPLASRE